MYHQNTKVLVIGQGICGTLLSWFLYQNNIHHTVIDSFKENAPSRIAAGLINPVTGRRYVTVWKDDILLPFAQKTYLEIEAFLQKKIYTPYQILDCFPNHFMKEGFEKRLLENNHYLENFSAKIKNVTAPLGIGAINQCATVNLNVLIDSWQAFLTSRNQFKNTFFELEALSYSDKKIKYQDEEFDYIIFCNGAAAAEMNLFSKLPFAINKGEALHLKIDEIDASHIYKKSFCLIPFGNKNEYWFGSNFIWNFEDEAATDIFAQEAISQLQNFITCNFTIKKQLSGLRPATIERRPFVGFHPQHNTIGILNGMGSKGCSLAPYYANQLVHSIIYQHAIDKEVDINRFKNILST